MANVVYIQGGQTVTVDATVNLPPLPNGNDQPIYVQFTGERSNLIVKTNGTLNTPIEIIGGFNNTDTIKFPNVTTQTFATSTGPGTGYIDPTGNPIDGTSYDVYQVGTQLPISSIQFEGTAIPPKLYSLPNYVTGTSLFNVNPGVEFSATPIVVPPNNGRTPTPLGPEAQSFVDYWINVPYIGPFLADGATVIYSGISVADDFLDYSFAGPTGLDPIPFANQLGTDLANLTGNKIAYDSALISTLTDAPANIASGRPNQALIAYGVAQGTGAQISNPQGVIDKTLTDIVTESFTNITTDLSEASKAEAAAALTNNAMNEINQFNGLDPSVHLGDTTSSVDPSAISPDSGGFGAALQAVRPPQQPQQPPSADKLAAISRAISEPTLLPPGTLSTSPETVSPDGHLLFNNGPRSFTASPPEIDQESFSDGHYTITSQVIGADMANVYISFINQPTPGNAEVSKLMQDLTHYDTSIDGASGPALIGNSIAFGLAGNQDPTTVNMLVDIVQKEFAQIPGADKIAGYMNDWLLAPQNGAGSVGKFFNDLSHGMANTSAYQDTTGKVWGT